MKRKNTIDVRTNNLYVNRTENSNRFMNDLSRTEVLSPTMERNLFAEYHAPETTETRKAEIKNIIMKSNVRFVFAIAKKYNNNDFLFDYFSCGYEGMNKAFDLFDYTTGNKFISFCVDHIRREIRWFVYREQPLIYSSSTIKYGNKVKSIVRDFVQDNFREPTDIEIKEILETQYDISIKNNSDIYIARDESIDAAVYNNEDDATAKDMLSDYNNRSSIINDYENTIEQEANRQIILKMFQCLNEREITALTMLTGYNKEKREYTVAEISEHLGVSSERVRQIILAAKAKCKQKMAKR